MLRLALCHPYSISCVIAENCGLSGLERDLLLTEHSTGNGCVLHKGTLTDSLYSNYGNIKNIEFLTHLSAADCDFFSEQL